ncbi:MAG: D-tyrosyl-tRNA(Tyr) deacylase [Bacteroidales bacterium]|nr:D-tyrosyl-tRNA(Tyr) deacylase [Bacteroidales bacterium]
MKAVIQRVDEAIVNINNIQKSRIKKGLLILVGIENNDSDEDIEWLAKKIINLRIFNDGGGIMNLSVKEIEGEMMVISQFTLHAKIKKGNRPSYINAAKPEIAIPVYEKFVNELKLLSGKDIKTGEFGAMMNISLINNGPVTIIIDTKNKE